MNIYRHRFSAPCVNNGLSIAYEVEIQTEWTIMVEEIVETCRKVQVDLEKPYHENIADVLYATFGGFQTMRAFHHGVEIESRRGG